MTPVFPLSERAAAELADQARDAGASEILIEVLLDTTAPAVVRERAFSRIMIRLAGRRSFALAA